MKNISVFWILLLFLLGGCVTTQTSIAEQNVKVMDLQELIKQLETLNKGSLETKRTAAIAILDNWLFDGGYWNVIFQNSRLRPEANVQTAAEKINKLAKEREKLKEQNKELSDYDLGQALGYYTIIVVGIVKFGAQEIIPQMAQLLGLF